MLLLPGIVEMVDTSTALPTVRFVPGGLGTLVYTSGVAMVPSLANGGQLVEQVLTVTDNVAFNITTSAASVAAMKNGQRYTLKIRNTSGGAHGAGAFIGAFKPAAAIPAIATGTSRTFEFIFDGTNLVEDFRSAADVAN